MRVSFGRKTALVALVILVVLGCVFFACACKREEVVLSLDFSLAGDLYSGESLTVEPRIDGEDEAAIEEYRSAFSTVEITEGVEIASIEQGKIKIAECALEGDKFKVQVTVKDLVKENEFTVSARPVEKVTLSLPEAAEAGDVIPLEAVILPSNASAIPHYEIVSGEAVIEGSEIKVSDRADGGEIVVKATAGGVSSEEVHVAVTTIQTRELSLTLSTERVLPGETLSYTVAKTPSNSSFGVEISLEHGDGIAILDQKKGTVALSRNAPIGSEIILVARSGYVETRRSIFVRYADPISLRAVGGGTVTAGTERSFDFLLLPESADPSEVRISVVDGGEYVDYEENSTSFFVKPDAPNGGSIVFYLRVGELYDTITYTIAESKTLTSLSIETTGVLSYLKSGASLLFTHQTQPENYEGEIYYRATTGSELVTVQDNVVTVREGAEIGRVTIVAESEDGTVSNEVSFTVSGRYDRRVYSSWSNVTFSSDDTKNGPAIWMVLPSALNAGAMTLVVPSAITDLVIEGHYDGTEESAYRDLYFYFRNAPERTITLYQFGTIATLGLGGTVFDLGSSGETEIVLLGENLIKADSSYQIDVMGEERDGIWDTGYSYASQKAVRHSGKGGYCGAAGGTALNGYKLIFKGSGNLTAVAGNGVNGTAGGDGADAEYDGSVIYVAGNGGGGGHGGDSGVAIHAYDVTFSSGFVRALPGNAGVGGMGGAAGSIAAVVGYDVTATAGEQGAKGRDGIPYPAVRATKISGTRYESATGSVVSFGTPFDGALTTFADKLSKFYGFDLYYGTAMTNPYAKKSIRYRYTMTQQTDDAELMRQLHSLMYTLSRIPKNAWQEIRFRSGKKVRIDLCKSIKSGSGSTILGLTSDANRLWFATFNTEIRGVYYGGYFNIMLHEFTHVFHYNFTASARSSFESSLKSYNYDKYDTSYSSAKYVYGLEETYDAGNSCYFSSYSRKNEMEDTAETLSIAATLLTLEPPMGADCHIRKKYDLLVAAFGREYETLSPFNLGVGVGLGTYPHLFDE